MQRERYRTAPDKMIGTPPLRRSRPMNALLPYDIDLEGVHGLEDHRSSMVCLMPSHIVNQIQASTSNRWSTPRLSNHHT